MQAKVELKLFGRQFFSTWPNIVSGILYILLGMVFIIFRGTSIVNGLQFFGLRHFFYDWQNILISGGLRFTVMGVIVLLLLVGIIIYSVSKEMKE